MTTTANSFLANGPAAIGFDARPSFAPHWFKFGALAVGHTAGVFGATNDVVTIPPGVNISAAVWGASMRSYGVLGQCLAGSAPGIRGEGGTGPGVEAFSSNNSGVSGAAGAWPSTFPPAGFDWQAGVSGQSQDHPAVTGFSINQYAFQGFSTNNTGVLGVAGGKGPDVPVPVPGNIAGVVGSSDQRPGVIGTSKASDGVYGAAPATSRSAIASSASARTSGDTRGSPRSTRASCFRPGSSARYAAASAGRCRPPRAHCLLLWRRVCASNAGNAAGLGRHGDFGKIR
jgi:hypothetical protein